MMSAPEMCIRDRYHWMDGIGPKEKRKKMINTHWGGVVEDNKMCIRDSSTTSHSMSLHQNSMNKNAATSKMDQPR